MELPKISIVIPSYNKAEFITKTLDSIFSQKYLNFEVIIQDGGSTDGTLEIIKKYTTKYPGRIIWSSRKDNGQVDAINTSLKKGSGDIFAFINADDVYRSGAFQEVGQVFVKKPDTLWLAGRGNVVDNKDREIGKAVTVYKNFLLGLNLYSLLLAVNYITQPSVFFSREAYKKYGPFTGTKNYVLEYDLWLKLGRARMPIVLSKTLSSFRLSGTNISSTSYLGVLEDDYKLVKKYTRNPLILLLHKINNWGRILAINLLK